TKFNRFLPVIGTVLHSINKNAIHTTVIYFFMMLILCVFDSINGFKVTKILITY
ncbi:MAG: hypothetical protein ACI9SI_001423, partial [Polaribacter sp.]